MNITDMFCRMNCYGMVEDENDIWFSWATANGVCRIDKVSGKAELLEYFEDYSWNQGNLYHSIQKAGDQIVFVPSLAESIAVYDVWQKKISYISLQAVDGTGRKETYPGIKFWSSILYGSFVYMFGYSYPAILKLNVETKEVKYLTDWVEKIEKRIVKTTDSRGYFLEGTVFSHYAFIPCGCTNAVLKLNLLTDQTEVIDLDTSVDGFGGIAFDGEDFWLVGRGKNSNCLICWNEGNYRLKEAVVGSFNEEYDGNTFWEPVCQNGVVYLFPLIDGDIYKADKQNGSVEISICEDFKCSSADRQCQMSDGVMRPHLYREKIRFVTCHDFIWHEYDVKTRALQSREIRFEFSKKMIREKLLELFSAPLMDAKWCAYQDDKLPLSVYLNCIVEYSGLLKNFGSGKSVGTHIWERLK